MRETAPLWTFQGGASPTALSISLDGKFAGVGHKSGRLRWAGPWLPHRAAQARPASGIARVDLVLPRARGHGCARSAPALKCTARLLARHGPAASTPARTLRDVRG